MRYRSRTVEVEASQWHRHGDHTAVRMHTTEVGEVDGQNGSLKVYPGDYIITETDGSGHYPCTPAEFEQKYEPVDANTQSPSTHDEKVWQLEARVRRLQEHVTKRDCQIAALKQELERRK